MVVLMKTINKYDATIKLLGIVTAALLLIPIVAQSPAQTATAQQNSSDTAAQGLPPTLDEIFEKIEKKLTGFGGAYLGDNGKLYVYFTGSERVDESQVAKILSDDLGPEYLEKGLVILKSDYAWNTWLPWKQMLRQLFKQKDLGLTSLDIDEKKQRIVLGFETLDEQKRSHVTGLLAKYPIPASVIELVEEGKGEAVTHDATTSFRPLIGGIPEGVVNAGTCTMGFVANKFSNNQRVIVTAGHCEAIPKDTLGDQRYTNPSSSSTVVGQEVANTNFGGNRWSDTLLFAPSVSSQLGLIYSGTIGSSYNIQGKGYTQLVGDPVCKMGYRTHETCGKITATNKDKVHPNSDGENYYGIIWSQNETDMTVNRGDSGAPVYKKLGFPYVQLYGILWLKMTLYDTPGPGVYSPIVNIERDQGTLIT